MHPMATYYQLDFEKPLVPVEAALAEAVEKLQSAPQDAALATAVAALEKQRNDLLVSLYADLSPWNTVRVARHPGRPQTRDYIQMMCRDFCELHGDRRFGDDPAIVCGLARVGHTKCMLIGHQKGKDTNEKIACHFGCAHPEGYRKALHKMKLAEKMGLPVVTLVDTQGAYPGLGAEQRGQGQAIAENMYEMSRLRTPILSVVLGEGGSGGALGIAVADRVAMLQYSWYSVISPEGCAAILWKEANEQSNSAAARALKMTAKDNLSLGIIEDVITEPLGGAHRDPKAAAGLLQDWILSNLRTLKATPMDQLLSARYERFRNLGSVIEPAMS